MNLGESRTTTRRGMAVTLFVLLGVLGGTGYQVHAAATKSDFTLAASPTSQTIAQGASTSFAVTVTRSGSFTGSVSLSVTGLPSGASGSFSPNPVGSSQTTSMLSIATTTSTPVGSYPLTIIGTSGSLSHSASVTLVVQQPATPNFSLSASPKSQSVAQGFGTSYSLTIGRSGGFTSPVSLVVGGLPNGATASFNPNPASGSSSTLAVSTETATPVGNYTLTITGTGGSPALTRSTTVALAVSAPNSSFTISGSVSTALYPGMQPVPLLLSLTNPYSWDLNVTNLKVTVRQATSKPSCDGTQNVGITQYSGSSPLRVKSSRTVSLADLGVSSSQWPKVAMLDQPWNQDACKGATFTLSYSASATKPTT